MIYVRSFRHRLSLQVARAFALLTVLCLATSLSQPAAAQNLLITFGGDYNPNLSYNDGVAFDGTDFIDLPPILDLAALEGGTFTASFTVPAALTPTSQTTKVATYDFGATSSVQFTLFDAAGHVKYQSSGLADFVQGRVYRFPNGAGNVDQFVYTTDGGFDVLGVTPPPGTSNLGLGPITNFNFANYTDQMHSYLSDLSFPTDAATYLSFPERLFNVQVAYGDGDIENFEEPFRFFSTSAYYTVNSVRITAVPEPGSLGLFAGLAAPAYMLLRRRRSPADR